MKLADALKEAKATYTELAAACGVHRKTVRRWAAANGKIPLQHARTLCDHLGVPLDGIYESGKYLPIDNNVPIPARLPLGKPGVSKPTIYVPWHYMKVGQSCFVPETLYQRDTLAKNCYKAGIRLGFRFNSRALTENGVHGTRVWRVE